MDAAAEIETVLLADHLLVIVLVLALAMQWLLHQVTERMARWHIALPGAVTTLIWAGAGWMIGGVVGVVTFVLGTGASLALAVVDERMRKARENDHHEHIRFG